MVGGKITEGSLLKSTETTSIRGRRGLERIYGYRKQPAGIIASSQEVAADLRLPVPFCSLNFLAAAIKLTNRGAGFSTVLFNSGWY
jgi:hypothetical protein